jgi:hypothetical protein
MRIVKRARIIHIWHASNIFRRGIVLDISRDLSAYARIMSCSYIVSDLQLNRIALVIWSNSQSN